MAPKKRIAFFTENLYGGGVERILQTILRYLDFNRFDVTLFSNKCEVIDTLLYPSDIHYRFVFDTINDTDKYVRSLYKRVCNKIKLIVYYLFPARLFYTLFIHKAFDVGIAFIEGYATRIVAGSPNAMRRIAWVHTDLINNPWTTVAFRSYSEERDLYNRFERIICVSTRVESALMEKYGIEGTTLIVHNPIDRNRVINLASEPLDDEYINNDKIRLVSIGSLIPIKGYDRLLRVFQDLLITYTNIELIIIGRGSQEQEYKQFIHEHGLDQSVRLTGYRSNPYPLLKSADVYVCSSIAEGYNTAITEALILGRPIVSTDCSGVREQLGDSEYGIVVENDNKSLLKGLQLMVRDSSIRQHYSFKASERGLFYCAEDVVAEIEDLL